MADAEHLLQPVFTYVRKIHTARINTVNKISQILSGDKINRNYYFCMRFLIELSFLKKYYLLKENIENEIYVYIFYDITE